MWYIYANETTLQKSKFPTLHLDQFTYIHVLIVEFTFCHEYALNICHWTINNKQSNSLDASSCTQIVSRLTEQTCHDLGKLYLQMILVLQFAIYTKNSILPLVYCFHIQMFIQMHIMLLLRMYQLMLFSPFQKCIEVRIFVSVK